MSKRPGGDPLVGGEKSSSSARMKTIEEEWGEQKRGGQGRQLRAAHEWSRLVEHYERSGLTQKAFARREGLRYATFVAWLGRVRQRRADAGKSGVRFATMQLPATATVSSSGVTADATLEVVLPGGLIVRGRAVNELAGLVRTGMEGFFEERPVFGYPFPIYSY
jgi:hypothetical protein